MNKCQRFFIIGMLTCFAFALRANAQVSAAGSVLPAIGDASAPSQAKSKAPPSRRPQTIVAARGQAARLCFYSGIGWQAAPAAASATAFATPGLATPGQLSALHGSGNSAPGGAETSGPTSSGSGKGRPFGAKQAMPAACLGTLPGQGASATAAGEQSAGDHAATMISSRSTIMNMGAQDRLNATPALNPASSEALQRLTMGQPSMAGGFTHSLQGSESRGSSSQIGGIKYRAYISPIKTRRMMRNAQDMQTRIAMRRSLDADANKHRASAAGSAATGMGAKEGEKRNEPRTHSSSNSGDRTNAAKNNKNKKTAHSQTFP